MNCHWAAWGEAHYEEQFEEDVTTTRQGGERGGEGGKPFSFAMSRNGKNYSVIEGSLIKPGKGGQNGGRAQDAARKQTALAAADHTGATLTVRSNKLPKTLIIGNDGIEKKGGGVNPYNAPKPGRTITNLVLQLPTGSGKRVKEKKFD